MIKYILKIDGMMCAHCEAHMNDAIRNNFTIKEVKASAKNNECVIISQELDEEKLRYVVDETGYRLTNISKEPYEKRGLFSVFKK